MSSAPILPPDTQEIRRQPLHANATSLNDRLQTEFIDVSPDDDSFGAAMTRGITTFVSTLLTPRQMLGILRMLKATTFCFLVLTVLADIMYIVFLEVLGSKELRHLAGGPRDVIVRIYGLFMAGIAIGIEVDSAWAMKKFSGLRGFVPRALVMFFIAVLTGSHPTQQSRFNNFDDDGIYRYQQTEIPSSALGFQMVTSFVL